MRPLPVLLVALLAFSALPANAQEAEGPPAVPFHISSFNTAFAMQGDFEGEFRVYPEAIQIHVTRADIRVGTHCPYKGQRVLGGVRFLLATGVEKGGWKRASESQQLLVERTMSPGDEYSLGENFYWIPRAGATDLSKYWLAVEMEDDIPGEKRGTGTAYAQSCKDIFSKQ